MLFFVFGLPGRFAEWCDTATAELARLAPGSTELIHADTLEQIALSVIGTGAWQTVVSSRQPGGRLCSALIENARNFVVALDDPGLALADLVLGRGVELAAATQAVASSCAALMSCRSAPGALILRRDDDWSQQAATIARHLQITVGDDEIADLVGDLRARDAAELRHDAGAWWSALATAEREMTAGALAPYIQHQTSGEWPSLTWTHELFFLGDRPAERATRPIEITGRARVLLCGPYIMLPPGSWSLFLTLLFSREAVEHEFLVEIRTDRLLATGTIKPQQEGSREITLDFALDALTEHPLSICVSSLRAAFDGTIAVGRAILVRAPSAADTLPATLFLAGG
jgi:hypothetical protein